MFLNSEASPIMIIMDIFLNPAFMIPWLIDIFQALPLYLINKRYYFVKWFLRFSHLLNFISFIEIYVENQTTNILNTIPYAIRLIYFQ